MKVLVVDDVDYIRKSISKVLEDNNFQCDSCSNGKQAIEHMSAKTYDLIITDIMMPDMDGFEFLDYIRDGKEPQNRIPVLAISGGSRTIDSDLALKMIKEKSDGILQKPFARSDLLDAITRIIGNERYMEVVQNGAEQAQSSS